MAQLNLASRSKVDVSVDSKVVMFAALSRGHSLWLCRCDCGTVRIVMRGDLVRGVTKSCGCLKREMCSARARVRMLTHGMSSTPEYRVWCGMKKRCTNRHANRWKYYGGRGIRVCRRWQRFENFFADMGKRPAGRTLDRIKQQWKL